MTEVKKEEQKPCEAKEQAKPEPRKKKYPVIDRKECAGCSVCVENCPMSCLCIEAPKFHGDIHTIAELAKPEQCSGCGICARHCPIRAIEMKEA
ncbi:MAG: 4Fe-4S binding protein [Peptococcaceae bacterium]|nr:4Fe-4S binding protein [Peptococcaceae bacterium]